jgi:hypothetical protein
MTDMTEGARKRAALAAGYCEVAEQDGLLLDLNELNKQLLADGLQPFANMGEVLQAAQEWRVFEAQATLTITKPPTH